MTKLFNWFRVIFTPSCWIQNYSYSPVWDAELRNLLRTEKFTRISDYEAYIGQYVVWVENHPYASFTTNSRVRPSRATILQAMDKLVQDYAIAEKQND